MNSKLGYRHVDVHVPVLFYTEDGLLLASCRDEMEAITGNITLTTTEWSLQISRSKSKYLIINRKKYLAILEKYIREIKVVEQV